jgi:hypothetical protein
LITFVPEEAAFEVQLVRFRIDRMVRLFRTADLALSKSGNRRTAFGFGRVRFEQGLRGIVRGPP